MEQIEEVCKAAKNSLEKAQKMMAIRNPGNKKFQPYQKNDQVWIEGTHLETLYPSAKLAPKHYRPFKVLKQFPLWSMKSRSHTNGRFTTCFAPT